MSLLSEIEVLQSSMNDLTGPANYVSWRVEIQIVAEGRGLYEFYTGAVKVMKRPDLCGGPDITEGQVRKYQIAIDRYKENVAKAAEAKALLITHVDPSLRKTLVSKRTPKDAWDYVESRYKMTASEAGILAIKEMENLKLKNFKNTTEFLSAFDVPWSIFKESCTLTLQERVKKFVEFINPGLPVEYHKHTERFLKLYSYDPTQARLRSMLMVAEREIADAQSNKQVVEEDTEQADQPPKKRIKIEKKTRASHMI